MFEFFFTKIIQDLYRASSLDDGVGLEKLIQSEKETLVFTEIIGNFYKCTLKKLSSRIPPSRKFMLIFRSV